MAIYENKGYISGASIIQQPQGGHLMIRRISWMFSHNQCQAFNPYVFEVMWLTTNKSTDRCRCRVEKSRTRVDGGDRLKSVVVSG